MTDAAPGHVWLVGAGPGDPGLVTQAGLRALHDAEVVLYDRLAPSELLDACTDDAERIDVGKAPGRAAMTQEQINAALVEHARAGKRVVRLKGGDPFVFGRGGEELEALAKAGVEATIVPGVTSAIGGLAAAGIPVTHRGVAASFAVVTGHEDPSKPAAQVRWAELATATDTLVVLMGVGRLDGITRALIEGGRPPSTPAALVVEATTPRQRVVEATLDGIAEAARDAGVEPPALLVVGDVVALRERIAPALRRPLAGWRVLVTRTRRQASTLAEALRAEGARPVMLPAIEIAHRADPDAVRAAIEALRAGAYQWVAFTSANAVEAWFDLVREAGEDARLFAGASIAAVGAATAGALEARGLSADLMPSRGSGEGMADALIEGGVEGTRVLVPRAEHADPALVERLRAAGATVDEVTLYLAAPPAAPPPEVLEAARAGEIHAVTFTSSSTVRNLVTLLGGDIEALSGAVVACIGPQTAGAAIEAGLPPQVVSEQPSVDGLVGALRRYAAEEA
ncbi:MAG: uroporphyrinogen-III C-methyltransferase [Chloroflexi bacterium]|nr:uroporphyrinogen-III C-methyltransferase [Chloroflexota bacterium]